MKKKNIILQKLKENELEDIRGGVTYKCTQSMPSHIRKKPQSSVYYAWLMAYCTAVDACSPTTWNECFS